MKSPLAISIMGPMLFFSCFLWICCQIGLKFAGLFKETSIQIHSFTVFLLMQYYSCKSLEYLYDLRNTGWIINISLFF